ncbi:hypothetical protein [Fimbriiglobus ruber]|uniref:Lipocalin-like domain-containing protein n=1 Tax=Fimbriiglobus ruber TaxID=1908690 RepID=A0A225DL64_9BACT|nr:hypothetical protein [Fimbriiglobus ruber]OWK42230.1 hypothetical protein FRUB_04308 [Fimbriiglobus ruber]
MIRYLLGTAVVFSAFMATASAEDAKAPNGKNLDGAWTVVCFERNGQPQADAKGMTVKAEGNTLTCSGRDGKPAVTMKLAFGPNGTIRVTETKGDSTEASAAKAGVYVLTDGYLAICVHADGAQAGADQQTAANAPNAKSHCSVILKREGTQQNNEK